jgi:hypothetical protein
MPREILRITPETTYGVYAAGNPHTVVDLPGDNSFTMRSNPNFWQIRSAGSDNLVTTTGTQTADLDGELTMYGRPAQSPTLASLLSLSGACPDVPSFTVDHGIFIDDGLCAPQLRRYLGVKASGGFDLTNEGQGLLMLWKLKLMGSTPAAITSTDFPTPAYSAYDFAERPFAFQDASGTLTYGGADISAYCEGLSLDVGTNLMAFRGAQKYRTSVRAFGRDPKITLKLLYYTQQFRTDFEANTPKSLVITFTLGAHSLVFNFGNANFIRQVGDDTKIGDFHRITVQLQNTLDPATGTDMSIVYTP